MGNARQIAEGDKPFDISATIGALGLADRMIVWAKTRDEAIAKFCEQNPRWRVTGVREATEINPSSYVE